MATISVNLDRNRVIMLRYAPTVTVYRGVTISFNSLTRKWEATLPSGRFVDAPNIEVIKAEIDFELAPIGYTWELTIGGTTYTLVRGTRETPWGVENTVEVYLAGRFLQLFSSWSDAVAWLEARGA